MKQLYKELSECFGPSGLEDDIISLISKKIKPYADELHYTPRGSLYAVIKGKSDKNPKVIASCCDETAFIISEIDDNGFIRVKELTPYNRAAVCGQAVTVGNEISRFNGVIAGKVLHLCPAAEREKPNIEKMFIDIGAKSRDEINDKLEKGDFAVYLTECEDFGDNKICGKALENRIGCALMIEAAAKTAEDGKKPENDLIFFFNTKSKVGASDLFSILNITGASEILLLSSILSISDREKEYPVCGNGIVIPSKDSAYLYYANELYKSAVNSDFIIQYPRTVIPDEPSARDGYASSEGAKVLRVCLPIENLATGREIADYRDILQMAKFIEAFSSL